MWKIHVYCIKVIILAFTRPFFFYRQTIFWSLRRPMNNESLLGLWTSKMFFTMDKSLSCSERLGNRCISITKFCSLPFSKNLLNKSMIIKILCTGISCIRAEYVLDLYATKYRYWTRNNVDNLLCSWFSLLWDIIYNFWYIIITHCFRYFPTLHKYGWFKAIHSFLVEQIAISTSTYFLYFTLFVVDYINCIIQ